MRAVNQSDYSRPASCRLAPAGWLRAKITVRPKSSFAASEYFYLPEGIVETERININAAWYAVATLLTFCPPSC
jgi:hypothetical protein